MGNHALLSARTEKGFQQDVLTMNELMKIDPTKADPTVSGRELNEFLEVKTKYSDWFGSMKVYGFEEGVDFLLVTQKRETNNPKNPYTEFIDHQLTIQMAKELCMIQRTEKGKKARQYFIGLEEAWNTPEMVMSRALRIADITITALPKEQYSAFVDQLRVLEVKM
jgi:anti-repressor protein